MKKRLVSLIVALCMMVSLVPFTAFAESDIAWFAASVLPAGTPYGALVLDPDGVPILYTGVNNLRSDLIVNNTLYTGTGWVYDAPQGQTTATLYLLTEFDLSEQYYTSTISDQITVVVGRDDPKADGSLKNGTVEGDLVIKSGSRIENVICNGTVTNEGVIDSGSFKGDVKNDGTIAGGEFTGKVDNNQSGTISDGTFNGTVTNDGTINSGDFKGDVTNNGTIDNGAFNGSVENNGTIHDGTFNKDVTNNGILDGGTFKDTVTNNKDGEIDNGTFNGTVKNDGSIHGGDFIGEVDNNQSGSISDGSFKGDVKNDGSISGGEFTGKVDNNQSGSISDGSFRGDVKNDGAISGGEFTGKVDNNENGSISGGSFKGEVDNKGEISGGNFDKADVDNKPGSTFHPGNDSDDTWNPNPSEPDTLYTVTIEGGTIHGKSKLTAKSGEESTVTLDKSAIPDGMAFDLWSFSSNALTGDLGVNYKAESVTFRMPAENLLIRAQYRSAEILDPYEQPESSSISPLGVAVLATAGATATGVALWQGYQLGIDLYLEHNLPAGTPVPTNRRELVLLMWRTAGQPDVEPSASYSDLDPQDAELAKAAQWAADYQLMEAANEYNTALFDPDGGVTKVQVFRAWRKLSKLLALTPSNS